MDSNTTSTDIFGQMGSKSPQPGELWLDEKAWAVTGKPRLLLVNEIRDNGTVGATAVEGGAPGPDGIPIHHFLDVMTWQGYWSATHVTLPRLSHPFQGSALSRIRAARFASKLSGSADVVNSLLPSLAPHDLFAYDRGRCRVLNVSAEHRVSAIPTGVAYLQFHYTGRAKFGGNMNAPEGLTDLWYQKQGNLWWLVRTLVVDLTAS